MRDNPDRSHVDFDTLRREITAVTAEHAHGALEILKDLGVESGLVPEDDPLGTLNPRLASHYAKPHGIIDIVDWEGAARSYAMWYVVNLGGWGEWRAGCGLVIRGVAISTPSEHWNLATESDAEIVAYGQMLLLLLIARTARQRTPWHQDADAHRQAQATMTRDMVKEFGSIGLQPPLRPNPHLDHEQTVDLVKRTFRDPDITTHDLEILHDAMVESPRGPVGVLHDCFEETSGYSILKMPLGYRCELWITQDGVPVELRAGHEQIVQLFLHGNRARPGAALLDQWDVETEEQVVDVYPAVASTVWAAARLIVAYGSGGHSRSANDIAIHLPPPLERQEDLMRGTEVSPGMRSNPGKHTAKQKRMAKHIEASERAAGVPTKRARQIAWATVTKRNQFTDRDMFGDAIENPSQVDPEARERAVAKYQEFHRKDPKKLEVVDFDIPSRVVCVGKGKWVTYRSSKVDPDTLEDPTKPIDYIHEHDAGVMVYMPEDDVDGGEAEDTPKKFRQVDALVKLGTSLGFCFVDEGQEVEAKSIAPMPTLYATPDGRCLLVVDGKGKSKRKVLAMMWGGGLGVEARGIVG